MLIFDLIFWSVVIVVAGSSIGALVYAVSEMRKPSVEEQMRQARNTYTNKSYASHR